MLLQRQFSPVCLREPCRSNNIPRFPGRRNLTLMIQSIPEGEI